MIYTSVTNRNWKLKQFDLNQAQKLAQDHSLNEIQSRLLAIRNIKSEEVKDFLNPTLKNLMPDPNIISDMKKAGETAVTSSNKLLTTIAFQLDRKSTRLNSSHT